VEIFAQENGFFAARPLNRGRDAAENLAEKLIDLNRDPVLRDADIAWADL